MMAKELVLIVFSCAAWGKCLVHKVILFQCDNMGVVSAIRKGSANESMVMHLLWVLWFFVAYFDITILIEHIQGIHNGVADQLSRNHMQQFFSSNPQAHLLPTPLPLKLQQIVSVEKSDWTSQIHTAVECYYSQGLATSTQKSYLAGQKRYFAMRRANHHYLLQRTPC